MCRTLGVDWYLPAEQEQELELMYTNRNIGALAGTFDLTKLYWNSWETGPHAARTVNFADGDADVATKSDIYQVRCARRD